MGREVESDGSVRRIWLCDVGLQKQWAVVGRWAREGECWIDEVGAVPFRCGMMGSRARWRWVGIILMELQAMPLQGWGGMGCLAGSGWVPGLGGVEVRMMESPCVECDRQAPRAGGSDRVPDSFWNRVVRAVARAKWEGLAVP